MREKLKIVLRSFLILVKILLSCWLESINFTEIGLLSQVFSKKIQKFFKKVIFSERLEETPSQTFKNEFIRFRI